MEESEKGWTPTLGPDSNHLFHEELKDTSGKKTLAETGYAESPDKLESMRKWAIGMQEDIGVDQRRWTPVPKMSDTRDADILNV